MALQQIAAALRRVEAALQRRPEFGLHEDAPATSRWEGGTRAVTRHANGFQVATDMPTELGGRGEGVTPGWLFRAGLASCATTSIVLGAAARGVALRALEVRAASRSDARGLLAMCDADGQPVYGGPSDVQLQVRIAADAASPEQLRTLVVESLRCSPVPNALQHATPLALQIDIEAA
jgi:uncharacterized OsmC-like protein